jgi:ferredoxin
MMKAEVNTNCIGCGLCPDVCPQVFELQDDGLAHVTVGEIEADWVDSAREAEAGCPVDAISVYDE